ncbi:hypothetical protein MBLNU459_g4859t1 [Dothideomycetes sp. NU459]
MAVQVLDGYYLAITLLITVGYQFVFLVTTVAFKFDKLNDFAGGTNFVILAIITLAFSESPNARQIVDSIFIMIWGARLSGFLLFRILKTGSDDRFDDKRGKILPMLGFYTFQTVWVWTVSMPVTLLNSPKVNQYAQPAFDKATDILAVIGFAIGITIETVSDIQKYRFKQTHKSGAAVCDKGFFKWSRHPNYFAEILIQFSIFMMAVTPASYKYVPSGSGPYAALYASILGPILLTTLLMFVSGLTLQERPGAKKRYEKGEGWPEYAAYLHRTSMLLPFPPQLYKRMPVFLKRTIFLEFPIYVFDPAKHADQSKVQQRQAEEGQSREGLSEEDQTDAANN